MTSRIRVLVGDDHQILREGLIALIEKQPDMEVVGQAGDGAEVIRKVAESAPDVVVLDISMGAVSGVEVASRVRSQWPAVRALVLTMHEDVSYVRAALAAGAAGYVVKRFGLKQVLAGIREVAAGRSYINVPLGNDLLEEMGAPGSVSVPGGARALSEREREVLLLVAQGHTNTEIGDLLGVAVKSVDTYRARAAAKLGLRTRADIVRYAVAAGLLRP